MSGSLFAGTHLDLVHHHCWDEFRALIYLSAQNPNPADSALFRRFERAKERRPEAAHPVLVHIEESGICVSRIDLFCKMGCAAVPPVNATSGEGVAR